MKKLFNVEPTMKHMSGGTYGFSFGSKAISSYLTGCIGLPSGRKPLDFCIPKIIEQDPVLKHHFIQGLVDTDFGFCLKKRYKEKYYYPVICFCSKSEILTIMVHNELKKKGFKVTKHYRSKSKDPRVRRGFTIRYRFDINGHKELLKFIDIMKLRHPKHIQTYKYWIARNLDKKRFFLKI